MKLATRSALCWLALVACAGGGCAAGRGSVGAWESSDDARGAFDLRWITDGASADGLSALDDTSGASRDDRADQRGVIWPIADYSRRVPIHITNTADALADYQVPVTLQSAKLIASGAMRTDCADMLVTSSDSATPVRHWLQGGCNTAATVVWVRVPALAAKTVTTLYLYHGNAGAASASSFAGTFVAANSDFELDALNTSKDAITHWRYRSGTTGENGEIEGTIVAGSQPCAETAAVSDAARRSGSKALHLVLSNCNTGGNSDPATRAAVQKVSLESSWRAVASGSTISLWLSEVSFTSPFRWRWYFVLGLSDGESAQMTRLVCRDWGHGEGCGSGGAYDHADQTATGADGKTWKRYTVSLPATYDRTSLDITIGHLQDTWDGSTGESAVYADSLAGFALRKYSSPEPTAAVGTTETKP